MDLNGNFNSYVCLPEGNWSVNVDERPRNILGSSATIPASKSLELSGHDWPGGAGGLPGTDLEIWRYLEGTPTVDIPWFTSRD